MKLCSMVLLPGPRTVSVTATQTSKRKGKAPETSLAREREIKGPQAAQGAHNVPLAHKDGKVDFGQKPLLVTLLEQEVCAVTTVGKAKGRNEQRAGDKGYKVYTVSPLLHGEENSNTQR